MILEMKVPSPGESITEVEIAEWLVEDGDYVEKDQAIAEVDSDKTHLLAADPRSVNHHAFMVLHHRLVNFKKCHAAVF